MTEWVPGISKAIIIIGGILVGMVHITEYDYDSAFERAREKYNPIGYNKQISEAIYRELKSAWPIVPMVYVLTLIFMFLFAGVFNNSLMILIALGSPFVAIKLSGVFHQKYLDQIAEKYQKRHP